LAYISLVPPAFGFPLKYTNSLEAVKSWDAIGAEAADGIKLFSVTK
jgi:hypothetical protein